MQDNNDKSSNQGKGGFWTTLPGVMAQLAALVIAITGLIAGLNQAGLIGTKPIPSPSTSPTPIPSSKTSAASEPPVPTPLSPTPVKTLPPSPKPSPTPVPSTLKRAYRVKSNDGFASLRAQPSTNSTELKRLPLGEVVFCEDEIVQGQGLWDGNQWRNCKKVSVSGFIYSPLLTPVER